VSLGGSAVDANWLARSFAARHPVLRVAADQAVVDCFVWAWDLEHGMKERQGMLLRVWRS
jgi:hypothetical protein